MSEISRGLPKAGAKVALLDINLEAAERVADEIQAAGGQALALQRDVTRKEDF